MQLVRVINKGNSSCRLERERSGSVGYKGVRILGASAGKELRRLGIVSGHRNVGVMKREGSKIDAQFKTLD